jgi:hypothetical protein
MARGQRAHLVGRSVSEACAGADQRAVRMVLTARPAPARRGQSLPSYFRSVTGAHVPPGWSSLYYEESPGSGHPPEFVLTTIAKLDTRAHNEVNDRSGHKNLSGLGERLHPLG